MAQLRKELFFVVNVDSFFLSHRLPIAIEAQKQGYKITVVACDTGKSEVIKSFGFSFIHFPVSRSGMGILESVKAIYFLAKLYKRHKPAIIHHIALKSIVYGTIASFVNNRSAVVNAVSGLGHLFIDDRHKNTLRFFVFKLLMHVVVLRGNQKIILQNKDDQILLQSLFAIPDSNIVLIKGSGVDLRQYEYTELPSTSPVTVVFVGRMLVEKGVKEFIQAAEKLRSIYTGEVVFLLVGGIDKGNPSSLSEFDLIKYRDDKFIKWHGHVEDVCSVWKNTHIAVLPSYREGLPKSLIEACAIGRPIVTTDVPGCREVVTDGINGFLVPVRNVDALCDKITVLIENPDLKNQMCIESRKLAEKDFSIENVVAQTLDVYSAFLK